MTADFEVNVKGMDSALDDLDKIKTDYAKLLSPLHPLTKNCGINGVSGLKICKNLRDIEGNMERQKNKVGVMYDSLNISKTKYINTERKLLGLEPLAEPERTTDPKSTQKNIVEEILKDDWEIEGAVVSGATTLASGKVFGTDSSLSTEWDVLGGSVKTKSKAKWDIENGDAGIEKSIDAEAHGASGKLKGNIGLFSGEISGTVGTVGASGTLGATLFKDGKFSPELTAKVKAEAAVAKGSYESKVGSDEYNMHTSAEGTLLGAEAEASVGAGVITYKDEKGRVKQEVGVEAKVGAEAYVAEGKVSQGITIFGIKIDASVSGKLGGGGVEAGGRVTKSGVKGKIGAGLGIGAGIEISIDWSDFSLF